MEVVVVTIDKSFCYNNLLKIKESGINVDNYIGLLSQSDQVPYSIIVFINHHIPIEQLSVFNSIYNKRKRNPLYKQLTREANNDIEKSIALSSFLTQGLIAAKRFAKQDKWKDYEIQLQLINADVITKALSEFIEQNNNKQLLEVFNQIRETFIKLFKE